MVILHKNSNLKRKKKWSKDHLIENTSIFHLDQLFLFVFLPMTKANGMVEYIFYTKCIFRRIGFDFFRSSKTQKSKSMYWEIVWQSDRNTELTLCSMYTRNSRMCFVFGPRCMIMVMDNHYMAAFDHLVLTICTYSVWCRFQWAHLENLVWFVILFSHFFLIFSFGFEFYFFHRFRCN